MLCFCKDRAVFEYCTVLCSFVFRYRDEMSLVRVNMASSGLRYAQIGPDDIHASDCISCGHGTVGKLAGLLPGSRRGAIFHLLTCIRLLLTTAMAPNVRRGFLKNWFAVEVSNHISILL